MPKEKEKVVKITLLGTGAAWPDANRNAPAFLVRHGDTSFLIDCGGGTCHQLMKVGVPPSTLEFVLLTHIHIDHCVEFPSLVFGAYLTGKDGPFRVFGPSGVEHFTTSIFRDTYDFAIPMMRKLRNKEIDIITEEVDSGVFFDSSGIRIEAAPVKHGIPTLAFRFTVDGKTVVFSGDTAPCDEIIEISKNADLLIIECSFPEDVGPKPGHCIPSQVANLANASKAKSLLLTHLFPICAGKEAEMVSVVRKDYKGPVEIGADLQDIVV